MNLEELPPPWSIKRWLFTTNHKDIGILYIVTSLYFLVVAGTLGLLMRTQLVLPENNFLSAGAYNQAVTIHGLMMVLWFLSPFAFGFANYIVPIQIGAKDLAFPRLNAMSYWFYVLSGILLIISFFFGSAPDTGWTLYAPLTAKSYTPYLGFDVGALALIMLVASVTMSTVNFLVTIVHSRAPGMKLRHMPLFTWSILVTVVMMLFAFPSLLAGLIMLFADRVLGTVYFSSNIGGSILWDHVFWFFAHPEVYIVLFPSIGAIGDILATFSRKPLYARKYIIGAMVVAAIISFTVWGHHMFVTGIDVDVRKLFTITTIGVSLPFDVIVLAFIHTLVGARIKLTTPTLFALGAIILFIIGGITGVFLGSNALDYPLRGTYWVVAHFHYIMVGTGALGLIAALYYWYPKITGRMYSETLGKAHFISSFIGINLLYFPMYFLLDMPRRVATYLPETGWGPWNLLATFGAFMFGISQLIMFGNIMLSLKYGQPAGNNPWKGTTLEWALPSPPPAHNFDRIPVITQKGLTFGTGAVGGRGNGEHELPETHLSPWPIMLALSTLIAFVGMVTEFSVVIAGTILGVLSLLGFGREKFVSHEPKVGEKWPFDGVERNKLAMWTFLASEVILFGVLIGSYMFVRVNSDSWPAPGELLSIESGMINTIVLLTSSATVALALAAAKAGRTRELVAGLIATLVLGLVFLLNKGLEWAELFDHGFTFSSGIQATSFYVTTGVHGAHVTAGLIALAYIIAKAFKRHYGKGSYKTVEYFGLYWHFVDIIWVFLFPIFYLI